MGAMRTMVAVMTTMSFLIHDIIEEIFINNWLHLLNITFLGTTKIKRLAQGAEEIVQALLLGNLMSLLFLIRRQLSHNLLLRCGFLLLLRLLRHRERLHWHNV